MAFMNLFLPYVMCLLHLVICRWAYHILQPWGWDAFLQCGKIFKFSGRMEKFRSTCCHRLRLALFCSCWCDGVTVASALHGGVLAIPADTFKPCRIQFAELKHFVSLCRCWRDCSAAGILLTGPKESLFPLRTSHLRLQVCFWSTWTVAF